jgi:aryl carrier-like protein
MAGAAGRIHEAFLRHRTIGPDTNFFEGGLDSRTLATVLIELRAEHPDLKLVDLYTYPTVRALAAELRRRGTKRNGPGGLPWAAPG